MLTVILLSNQTVVWVCPEQLQRYFNSPSWLRAGFKESAVAETQDVKMQDTKTLEESRDV